MNLIQALKKTSCNVPNRTALVLGDRRVSYRELDDYSDRIASYLVGIGIKKSDHIAILTSHTPDWAINFFGILKSGGAAILLSTMLKEPELASLLADSDAKVLITEKCFLRSLSPYLPNIPLLKYIITVDSVTYRSLLSNKRLSLPDISIDDSGIATIIYTSGVLGRQKGVVHTHASLMGTPDIVSAGLKRTVDDVVIDPVPFFYLLGLSELLFGSIIKGCTVVIVPHFTPRAILEAVEIEKGSILFGVPAMYNALAMTPHSILDGYDVSSLRVATSAGAKSSPRLMKTLEEKLGLTFCETYGLSELSVVAMSTIDNHKIGTVGKPIVELRIISDAGEVVDRGEIGEAIFKVPWMMKEYYKAPDLTSQVVVDGWFHTGDLVRLDGEGYLEYVEKKSFIIVTPSGLKISPWDVEEVILSHPAVAEAAYVGVGCKAGYLTPTAFIVTKNNQAVSEEEIAALCRQNLADFKLPKKFMFVDSIPRTGSGKIRRQQLKESWGSDSGI